MIARITPEDILAHPRFAEARAAHIDAVVALFKADRFATRMMADVGVILFRAFLVGFHVAFDVNDPTTWATPSNVRQALVARNLASPRRVDDLLARFRQAGYVESLPSPGDRRMRILVPTARLIAHDRDHLAAYQRFLLDLFPGRGYEWVLGHDEAVHKAIRFVAFQNQARATSALNHEAVRLFLAFDAGYLALLLVMQAQLSDTIILTWKSLSDELGVSRSHLRTLFARAEAEGYVRIQAGDRRLILVLPPLWQAYDTFLAGVEADQDVISQEAFLAL